MVTPYADGAILRAAGRARPVSIEALTGDGAVLVLTPHPDDESLGCGAAIAAASRAGREIVVVALTDGRLSHPGSRLYPTERLVALRQAELHDAVARLTGGAGTVMSLGYPDQAAPSTPAELQLARQHLLRIVDERQIGALWTTWEGDPHPDHQSAARLARAVVAERPGLAFWRFAVWGRFTEETPPDSERLYRFDAVPFRDDKAAAIAAHRSQMTGLIADDPDGFVMDDGMRRHFLSSAELFIGESAGD